MKLTQIITLLAAALFFAGCASKEIATTESPEQVAPATGNSGSSVGTRTAYDGNTGSGLLMERYKSGNIEGFRN
jgi:uncharacterized lipoprotein YajG